MSGFKIPLNFSEENFYDNNYQSRGNEVERLRKSVDDFLSLLVNTPKGSFKPQPQFGFSLTKFRFENADAEDRINKEVIRGESDNRDAYYALELKETIARFEPRLQNPEVEIRFDKKISKVSIFISGKLVNTKEDFEKNIIFQIW
ncbi:MAG: GPW/gp25 family protein [Dysgonamonadaceae bacterium]|jgi:predicted component of type VI protein secretion system|nr:GPW/gp25 family protein [Dysgonamonadaceae bacterium]